MTIVNSKLGQVANIDVFFDARKRGGEEIAFGQVKQRAGWAKTNIPRTSELPGDTEYWFDSISNFSGNKENDT